MASPVQLTPAVLASLRIPASAAPAAADLLKALVGQAIEATLEAAGADGLHLRLANGKEVVAQGSLPFPAGSALLLKALPLPGGAGLQLQVVRATPPPPSPLLQPLVQGEAAPLLARLQSPAPALEPLAALFRALAGAGEESGAWTDWMKGALRHLSDPAVSPGESVFHRLQAREGTAWFELPLPWAGEPLRLWVESDRGPDGTLDAESVHRVFLSVPFSALGEVRMGLEQRSSGLKVRLWLEDPARLAPLRAALEAELAALGRPAELQILSLPPGAPDLRTLAGAPSLSALG